jgi:predicted MFS family arabinose efflux permease
LTGQYLENQTEGIDAVNPDTQEQATEVDRTVRIVAALFVFVMGSISFPLLPMVVGAVTDHLDFSTREVGLIASADMFGMFLAAIAAIYWIRRANWRRLAIGLALCLCLCHVVSSQLQHFAPLLAVRLLAGFCGGSMMALGGTALTDGSRPERNTALFIGMQMAVASAGFLVMPRFIEGYGVAGAYGFLAALAMPALIAAFWMPSAGKWPRESEEGSVAKSGLTGSALTRAVLVVLFATLPAFWFHVAYAASWAYIERLGVASGMSVEAVGQTLSLSFLAGIGGSVVAWLLSDRIGRLWPCVITLALQLASLGVLGFYLTGPTAYVLALMVYVFCITFPFPYLLAFAIEMDRTGRAAVLFLLMVKAGIAIGPFFASNFVSKTDFTLPLLIAAIFYSVCLVNLWGVALLNRAISRDAAAKA